MIVLYIVLTINYLFSVILVLIDWCSVTISLQKPGLKKYTVTRLLIPFYCYYILGRFIVKSFKCYLSKLEK